MVRFQVIFLGLLFSLGIVAGKGRSIEPAPAEAEFFEKKVRPLLAERCFECHGAGKKLKGGLKLTSKAALLEGGESGPAAIPGQPEKSLLIQAIRYQTDDLRMPPKGKMTAAEIATLTRWVKMGLPWPADKGQAAKTGPFRITEEQRRFWSFQAVQPVAPPAVKKVAWPRTGLDRFILAGLEAKGMKPAKRADRRTLIRRATFDLTGLPPSPEEIDAFLKDDSPDAFARVLDRLLASPHYGERWGRHWLDLVRYADSFDARILSGDGRIMDITEAWRYRDWVIDAFNRDLPYDRFLMDQIAGDLLPARAPGAKNVDGIIATGVLAIGNWGGGDADKEKMVTDIVDDQLDIVGRVFMGLTVTCARCHDHKFDPLSTQDYYGLAGIFFSTHILPNVGPRTNGPPMLRIPLLSAEEIAKQAQHKTRLAQLEKQLQAATADQVRQLAKDLLPQTADYLLAAWEYQHRPVEQAKMALSDFAAGRKLHAFALAQWLDFLTQADEYQLMTTKVRKVLQRSGVHAYRGQANCPNITVNNTKQEVSILTFKLPPRSVAVHPGPNNGVVVGWKSPLSGTVKVTGKVVDADPVGGDGIAWIIDHRKAGGARELASGDIPNGGRQNMSQGKGAANLKNVEVKPGDMIHLLVLPKKDYGYDTTIVDLVIAKTDGSAAWDLTPDIVDNLHQGNPHDDRLGNKAVWHFLDMAKSKRGQLPGGFDSPALADWHRTVEGVAAGKLPRSALIDAAKTFQKNFNLVDERSPFWIRKAADEKYLPRAARLALAKLQADAAVNKSLLAPVPVAHGAQEGGIPGCPHEGIHDVKVHIRGSYLRLGELVARRFPLILAGDKQPPITRGSGRLELARWLARPEHPLTARVLVNRIWQHHFGEGLVRTPNNFGKLGERPTHPELLDYLAGQFIESGWSMKKMHRLIMLSATYQQASRPEPETLKQDPDNRLWGRMNRRRLEAEAIRDNLLAVAGRLERTRGGPATQDFKIPRRTLYQMTVRSDRTGFGPLFDMPDSTSTAEKRILSTVAPQALFLLNHPFVLEQTQALAKRILGVGKDNRERIEKAYLLLYGRPPLAEEVQIGLDFLSAAGNLERAWEEYCQVLLCTNEFIFVD